MMDRVARSLILLLMLVPASRAGAQEETSHESRRSLAMQDQTDQGDSEPAPSSPSSEAPAGEQEAEDTPAAPDVPTRPLVTEPSPEFPSLARAPNMFGDAPGITTAFIQQEEPAQEALVTDMPLLASPLRGGSRTVKIGENDKALPQDRIFYFYNSFHNAGGVSTLNRHTLGAEKTFHDGRWSVAVRMPLTEQDFRPDRSPIRGGQVGNLAVITKLLLHRSENWAAAAGLAIDTPTGSDAQGQFGDVSFEVENEAVHLAPFVGFLSTPHQNFFYQAFLQVDVPANGNPITVSTRRDQGTIGKYTEQTLLFADASVGYWLYRDSSAHWLQGIAPVLELHYTSTLQETDVIRGFGPGGVPFSVQNAANRVDALNISVGLHSRIGDHTTVRVGGVFPLRKGDNRLFDGEFLTSVNVFF